MNSLNNILNILVIDVTDKNRGKANTLAFNELEGIDVYFYNGSKTVKSPAWEVEVRLPNKINLVFLHDTDVSAFNNFVRKGMSFDTVIRYTGAEGLYSVPTNEIWIQQRAITSASPLLTSEAKSILQWLNIGQPEDSIPDILSCRTEYYASAISILCQGYLATNSKSTNPLVQKALEEMGWSTFKSPNIHTDLSDKESETKQTSWWLEPFSPMTIDEIHKQIVKEWNKNQYSKPCDRVCQLLQALKQDTIEDPTIVANAYLAISERLTQE